MTYLMMNVRPSRTKRVARIAVALVPRGAELEAVKDRSRHVLAEGYRYLGHQAAPLLNESSPFVPDERVLPRPWAFPASDGPFLPVVLSEYILRALSKVTLGR